MAVMIYGAYYDSSVYNVIKMDFSALFLVEKLQIQQLLLQSYSILMYPVRKLHI